MKMFLAGGLQTFAPSVIFVIMACQSGRRRCVGLCAMPQPPKVHGIIIQSNSPLGDSR